MKNVYVVMKVICEEYIGTYREIVSIYKNKNDAMQKVEKLTEENNRRDTEYYCEEFNVI